MKRIPTGLTKKVAHSDGNVPCGTCTRCCYLKTISLHPDRGDKVEELNASLHRIDDGTGFRIVWTMPRKSGHCAYLVNERCTIYEDRPSTCREFDCRAALLTLNKKQKAILRKEDGTWKRVFRAAEVLQSHESTSLHSGGGCSG